LFLPIPSGTGEGGDSFYRFYKNSVKPSLRNRPRPRYLNLSEKTERCKISRVVYYLFSLRRISIGSQYEVDLIFQFIKSFKLAHSYVSTQYSDAHMFKVIGLIVLGIFLMTFGTYFLSIADLPVLHLPDVNWTLVGFVTLIGSIVTFGSAFAVSKLA
jgi:hypothetical protein